MSHSTPTPADILRVTLDDRLWEAACLIHFKDAEFFSMACWIGLSDAIAAIARRYTVEVDDLHLAVRVLRSMEPPSR